MATIINIRRTRGVVGVRNKTFHYQQPEKSTDPHARLDPSSLMSRGTPHVASGRCVYMQRHVNRLISAK